MLAIDFSKANTGIAFGRPPDLPKLLSHNFDRGSDKATLAECAGEFVGWFEETMSVFNPEVVLLEAALAPQAGRNAIGTHLALGADFVITGYCYRKGIKLLKIHGGTWKSKILGTSALKSSDAKRRARSVCDELGIAAKNHDQADAACIWLHGAINLHDFPRYEIDKRLSKAQGKFL